MNATTRTGCFAILLLTVASLLPVRADGGLEFTVPEGETHDGDLYLSRGSFRIDGTQNGDLIGIGGLAVVTGTVNGDIAYFGQKLDLRGTVNDSVRAWTQDFSVEGTVDGDVIVGAATVTIMRGARITGDARIFAGHVIVDGDVEGRLSVTGGQLTLGGTVGRDAKLKVDELDIRPDARIAGDLRYTCRNELDLEGKEIVAGTIGFEPEEPEKPEPPVSVSDVGFWIWFLLGSIVIGLVALAVMKGPSRAIVETVGADALRSAGVGFVTLIVVPVAGVIACLLIVTIPLVALVALLYVIAIYVAKLPVAVWLGGFLMRKMGRSDPSPYGALLLGVPLLYLLFLLPVIGTLIWFLCLFLGFGAMVLGIRSYREARATATS